MCPMYMAPTVASNALAASQIHAMATVAAMKGLLGRALAHAAHGILVCPALKNIRPPPLIRLAVMALFGACIRKWCLHPCRSQRSMTECTLGALVPLSAEATDSDLMGLWAPVQLLSRLLRCVLHW